MNSKDQWTPQLVRILETYCKMPVQQLTEMFPTHVIGLSVGIVSQIEVLECPQDIFFNFTVALTDSFLSSIFFFFLFAQLRDSGTLAHSFFPS